MDTSVEPVRSFGQSFHALTLTYCRSGLEHNIAAAVEKYLGTGSIPETWRLLLGLDRIDSDLSGTQHPEAAMEIRSQSRGGPLVSPLAEISASGVRLEIEIHDTSVASPIR